MATNIPRNEAKGLQPTLLYPARLSIKMEGQIRNFPNKRSLSEYTSTKLAQQEMLMGQKREKKSERERNTGTKNGNK